MPEKEWIVWLNDACRVETEKHTRAGRVTGFRVVLLADIDGETHCVTRFDTAHGFAHRDVLAFGGRLVAKKSCRNRTSPLLLRQHTSTF